MVHNFIAFIREANELLQQEIDLSPANQRVAGIISRLSLQLKTRYMPEEVQLVLNNEYIRDNLRSLQEKLSDAEFLEELTNSRRLYESKDSALDIIARLPNWNVYIALVREELSALRQFNRPETYSDSQPLVFVGSGPLPLSPIIMHLLGGVDVICIEKDSAAYEASCALLEKMGLMNHVTVVLNDGAEFDYSCYNRVFVASLVRNKLDVIDQISRTSDNPLIAVRTAEGMKQIMYESIDEMQLNTQGWLVSARTSPVRNLVINSTLFLERAVAHAVRN